MGGEKHDGELLEAFARGGSEAPFEELVRRHGALVFGVCRRILGASHDAEDAAQAVFLTLAHKAGSLRGRESIASWLHQVAWHVALRARESAALRRKREEEAALMQQNSSGGGGGGEDGTKRARALLDEELGALPEKYRLPLILHHFEGWSEAETAQRLRCNTGTLSTRLSRGRDLLRERLARRGAVLSAAMLAALLSGGAEAALPAAFAAAAAQAAVLTATGNAAAGGAISAQAAALTKGVLEAMLMAKMKAAAAVVAGVLVLGGGASVISYRAMADGQAETKAEPRGGNAQPPRVQPVPAVAVESAPVTKDGLALTVRLAKTSFLHKEPIEFEVVYKNVSDKGMTLWNPQIYDLTRSPLTIRFGEWEAVYNQMRRGAQTHAVLEPGGTQTVAVKVELGEELTFKWMGRQRETPLSLKELPPGKYALQVKATLAECKNLNGMPKFPYWAGEVASNSIEIEVRGDEAKPAAGASAPAEKNGLTLSVRPSKLIFAQGEPIQFEVVYKNVSDKGMTLRDPGFYNAAGAPLTFSFGSWAAAYTVEMERSRIENVVLAPGESRAIAVKVNQGSGLIFKWTGPQMAAVKPLAQLPPGKYALQAKATIGAPGNQDGTPNASHWKGEISSNPIDIEVLARTGAAQNDGLAFSLTTVKKQYAPGEMLEFKASFQNMRGTSFLLYSFNLQHAVHWKFELEESGTGKPVALSMSKQITSPAVIPVYTRLDSMQTTQTDVALGKSLFPAIDKLAPGKYRLSATANFREGPAPQDEARKFPYWTGEIRCEPVEFLIVK